jgi:hypothetical protein
VKQNSMDNLKGKDENVSFKSRQNCVKSRGRGKGSETRKNENCSER